MTAPDNPVPLKSVKPEGWPERLYGGKAVVRFPSGVESGNWYSKPDVGGDQTREYIRADVARADAQTAQALVAELAAVMIEDNVRHAKELGREIWAMPDLRALAPAPDPAAIREAALREAAAVATACERQNHARVSDSETHGIYRLGLEAAGQAIAAGILALLDKPAPDHSATPGNMVDKGAG